MSQVHDAQYERLQQHDAQCEGGDAEPVQPKPRRKKRPKISQTRQEEIWAWLDEWPSAVPGRVRKLAADTLADEGKVLVLDDVVGQTDFLTVEYVLWPTAALWFTSLLYPFALHYLGLTICPRAEDPFASYEKLSVLPFALLLVWVMYREWEALKNVLIVYALRSAPFKFLGINLSIIHWLVFVGGLSCVSKIDVCTCGLVLAKMWKTEDPSCPHDLPVDELWEQTIKFSVISLIPSDEVKHRAASLTRLTEIAWGMMFLQALSAAWSYARTGSGDSQRSWAQYGFARVFPADAVRAVATAGRMVFLVDKGLEYQLTRVHDRCDLAQGHTDQEERNDQYRMATEILRKETALTFKKALLYTLLNKAALLELQCSIFSISRFLLPRDVRPRFDYQLLVGLLASYATFAKALFDHFCQLRLLSKSVLGLREYHNLDPEIHQHYRWTIFHLSFFFVVFILCNLTLAHVSIKFVATWWCENSMWDLPWSNPHVSQWGCVTGYSLNATGFDGKKALQPG